MASLSDLERAVLTAIAEQAAEHAPALHAQITSAQVVQRENTGHGFYTTLAVKDASRLVAAASPLGDIGADVVGVEHGMGFLLWVRDGLAEKLKGYTYDGDISRLELTELRFSHVGPRQR